VLRRKRSKDRERIVANGEEPRATGGERGEHALQLDELRLAEGSPGRAAVEHHQGPPGARRLMEMHGMAMLIR
jgi:hypothetical protein